MSQAARAARVLAGVVVLVVGVALAAVLIRLAGDRLVVREACAATVGDVETRIGIEEAEHASAIVAEATRRGLSLERTTTALTTAWPDLKPERAAALASALTGRTPAAFSCSLRPESKDAETAAQNGLTPRADAALTAVEAAFGDQKVGGFDPKGVRSGHMDGSAHYSGRAVDVFFRPVTKTARQQGWATAQWLVANAERLDLATVIYDGRIWTARRSGQGWRAYVPPSGNTKNATLMHRDHVHLDVP